MTTRVRRAVWLLALVLLAAPLARAEVIEEIVALVDGDILTKSEYELEEQVVTQEIYRRYTGEELDAAVATVKRTLLMDLVDRRILIHRAGRMFDIERMGEVFFDGFRRQQQVTDEAEFKAMLEQEGMTVESLKKRLINNFAPDEVVRFEVSSRISVADHEIDAYYAEHPDEFRHEDQVTLREIVLLADSEEERAARRAEIDEIYTAVTAETFAHVAAAVSEAGTQDAGGLLGVVKRGDLSDVLEGHAFELEVGEWSGVLEMPYGFHILFVEERLVGVSKTLEEVRAELRQTLEDERFSERLREFMVKARGESDWCVKESYAASLAAKHADKVCKEM